MPTHPFGVSESPQLYPTGFPTPFLLPIPGKKDPFAHATLEKYMSVLLTCVVLEVAPVASLLPTLWVHTCIYACMNTPYGSLDRWKTPSLVILCTVIVIHSICKVSQLVLTQKLKYFSTYGKINASMPICIETLRAPGGLIKSTFFTFQTLLCCKKLFCTRK